MNFLSSLLCSDQFWVPPSHSLDSKSFLQGSRWGVKLTTHLHPLPSLRMCGAIPPLHHTSSWYGA